MLTFTAPQLSPSTAHLLSFAFSALYVGSIYVSAQARLSFNSNPTTRSPSPTNGHAYEGSSTASASSRGTTATNGSTAAQRLKMKDERWRDDPEVIKARLIAVCIATTLCCGIVYHILRSLSLSSPSTSIQLLWDLLFRLGFVSFNIGGQSFVDTVWMVLRPHFITPVLFFGPLYAMYLSQVLPGQIYWSWELHVRRDLFTWQGIRNVILVSLLIDPLPKDPP